MAISDKMLAVLLVTAIIISVGGALLTITQVTNLVNTVPALKGIAGLGVYGRVNITIAALASINVSQTYVDFGIGYVKAGMSGALLNSSNGTGACDPVNWTVDSSSCSNVQDIILQNVGTKDLIVDVCSVKSGATMIGGTGPGYNYTTYNATASGVAGCVTGTQKLTPFNISSNCATGETENICNNLTRLSGQNMMNVSIVLLIPSNAPAGNKTDTLTFNVTSA
jgi:hypothetical protein